MYLRPSANIGNAQTNISDIARALNDNEHYQWYNNAQAGNVLQNKFHQLPRSAERQRPSAYDNNATGVQTAARHTRYAKHLEP